MKRHLLIIASCAVICSQSITPSWGSKQKLKMRAYKTVDRNTDWCVKVIDQNGKQVSKSTFKRNTDGVTTRALYLEIDKSGDAYNKIVAYQNKSCSGNAIESKPIFARGGGQFQMEGSGATFQEGGEIQIEANAIRIMGFSLEPKDSAAEMPSKKSSTKAVGAQKLGGTTKTWLIRTSDNKDPNAPYLSSASVLSKTTGAKSLLIFKDKPTWVFVYKNTSEGSQPNITEIGVDELGLLSNPNAVLAISSEGKASLTTADAIAPMITPEILKEGREKLKPIIVVP